MVYMSHMYTLYLVRKIICSTITKFKCIYYNQNISFRLDFILIFTLSNKVVNLYVLSVGAL